MWMRMCKILVYSYKDKKKEVAASGCRRPYGVGVGFCNEDVQSICTRAEACRCHASPEHSFLNLCLMLYVYRYVATPATILCHA